LPGGDNAYVELDFAPEVAVLSRPGFTLAQNEQALIDHLDGKLCGGRMSPFLRARISGAFAALPTWFGSSPEFLWERARLATYLVFAAPEYVIQK
jgi:hypothetical protein